MQISAPIAKPTGFASCSLDDVKAFIDGSTAHYLPTLRTVNKTIHDNPELAWEETIAHDTLVKALSSAGFQVTPSAYGIKTAFEARNREFLPGGRCVNFNAEYDALPNIGHACGHNLITVASLTAFLTLSAAVETFGVAGKVQLLGTPAEESGSGKIVLLDAGAYKSVDVSLMGHPFSQLGHGEGYTGTAGQRSFALLGVFGTFHGKNAHASANPWDGVNALDGLVLAYNNVSALRQQIHPDERVHGAILEAPKVTNVIPSCTKMEYTVRSPTMAGTRKLGDKVKACLEAAALATGCTVDIYEDSICADLRVNKTLCESYSANMARFGESIMPIKEEILPGSTDQGNVTYAVPALHVSFGIPGGDIHPHDAEFAQCAITEGAFQAAVRAGKSMAMTGWEILTDDKVWEACKNDFEQDRKIREKV